MVISSKGYALRVMVDLAEHGGDGYVSMRDVARRQEISDKYAGQIMTLLSRAGLVDGVTGKGGGYRLTRRPEEYPLGEILRLTEGSLAPVACLEEGAHPCGRARMLYWIKIPPQPEVSCRFPGKCPGAT